MVVDLERNKAFTASSTQTIADFVFYKGLVATNMMISTACIQSDSGTDRKQKFAFIIRQKQFRFFKVPVRIES